MSIILKENKKFFESVALTTYSHSSFKDILDIYFLQLSKFLPQINGYLLIDKLASKIPNNHQAIFYNDNFSYCKHMIDGIKDIKEDYIIYMQDDFFLLGKPDLHILTKSLSKINSEELDFIRLIRSGDMGKINFPINKIYYKIPRSSDSLFSMQATLWKKSSLDKLFKTAYNKYPNDNIWESEQRLNQFAQELNLKGLFLYNNEKKRGKNHWDSNYFPYIATAIVKGEWNFMEYKTELMEILTSNKIFTNRSFNISGAMKKIPTLINYYIKLLK